MKLKKSTPILMIGLFLGLYKCILDHNPFGVFLAGGLIVSGILWFYFIWNDM